MNNWRKKYYKAEGDDGHLYPYDSLCRNYRKILSILTSYINYINKIDLEYSVCNNLSYNIHGDI